MSKLYDSSVLLRIGGSRVDPEVVTARLGLEPHRARRAHDPLGDDPASVAAPLDPTGSWRRYPPPEVARSPVEDQIVYWLEELEERAEALAELRDEGLLPALSCFVRTDTVASVVLSPELIERLERLELQVELSIFAESEE